ncbi:MAG: hypothetical protein LBL65_04045 [Campylobacteraceae bacterium]|nr:hypothetical protein [Campylobacteraceae bacterium]
MMSYIKLFFINIFGYYELWMLWLFLFIALTFIITIIFILNRGEEYKKFNSISLYNVIWKWRYKKSNIIYLWCYCPECGSELICDDEYCRSTIMLTNKTTFLICRQCGEIEKGRVIGGDRNYLLRMVRFEIQKRIKNSTYKNEAKT